MSTTQDWRSHTPLPKIINYDELVCEVDRLLPFSNILCCTSGSREGHTLYPKRYMMYKSLSMKVDRDGVSYVVKVHNFVEDKNEFDEHLEHVFTDPHDAIKKYNVT